MSCCPAFCQQLQNSYINYNIANGFAGNTVYCTTQDKEGFMWFGTETGLSRFDGTHFKNFTVADGLPDNEILKIFCDSKGRIWMAPFKKSICYYYKGRIHTQQNDSILAKINLINNIYGFCEDKEGTVFFTQVKRLSAVTANGNILNWDSINGTPIKFLSKIARGYNGGIRLIEGVNLYHFQKEFSLVSPLTNKQEIFSVNESELSEKVAVIINPGRLSFNILIMGNQPKKINYTLLGHTSFSIIKDSLLFINKINSSVIYNIYQNRFEPDTILKETNISHVYSGNDDEFWFLTLGQGVFKLTSPNVFTFLKKDDLKFSNFIALNFSGGSLYASNEQGSILSVTDNFKKIIIESKAYLEYNAKPYFYNKNTNADIVFSPVGLFSIKKDNLKSIQLTYKNSDIVNDSTWYIATSSNVIKLNPKSFLITDTIWKERATAVLNDTDSTFIGTLNGLFVVRKNKTSYPLAAVEDFFNRRISNIKKAGDGIIWVSTYDAGLAAYKDGKITHHISDTNGLTSNICRNMFLNGNFLWVGTDKGLNKIDISSYPYKVVIKYTTSDGLASNMINAVYAGNNMVYIGTPAGLTFFDERKVSQQSSCRLNILGITIAGKIQMFDSTKLTLKNSENNIRFDFVAISFKSSDDVTYMYRLTGLNDEWRNTRENYISYPILPSGKYQFEVMAMNKFGVASETVLIPFEIEKKLIEKIWFWVFIAALILGMILWYYNRRITLLNKRAGEKAALTSRIFEMEQMALRAQMNPHFIFNSLNSIQQYVIDADVKGANRFITGFSRLIRKTLDHSSNDEISIQAEKEYICTYLELEQMRFENKFEYFFNIAADIDKNETCIPPMLLQPYVENAIRHGINNKKEGTGKIDITITIKDNNLICEITDNGIGRLASEKLKGNVHLEYQSKGMELTAKRVELLNMNRKFPITVSITDLINEAGNPLGTKVTILFPY